MNRGIGLVALCLVGWGDTGSAADPATASGHATPRSASGAPLVGPRPDVQWIGAQPPAAPSGDIYSQVRDLPLDQAAAAVSTALKFQGVRGYQRDLEAGKSPSEALARWGPLMYNDNPAGMANAAALARAAAPAAGPRITPRAPEQEGRKVVSGTGFFVTDDGYFVTCEHVVRGASSFSVKLPTATVTARVVITDRTIDIALLKASGASLALPVLLEPRVNLGESVLTVGFPNPDVQGERPKLTKGEISSLAGMNDNPNYFQISVPVQPGNSGGALVNESGNVVGVVTARLDDIATYKTSGALPQNVNYAVKGNLVRDFLDKVPELAGKLKAPRSAKDREAAPAAAERAAVLVIAE